jgi:multidrug resistance protein
MSAGSRPILFLTVFIHLLGFGIILPLLPYFAETYGASGTVVGLLSASFSLMQFLFAPLWGRLSDRVGRRPVLLGSLLVTGASYILFATATSLPALFASRILAGIAGAVIPAAQAYIADTTAPENRTKGMGLIYAAFGMGFIFGPALGGALSRWGYAVPGYAAAGLALAAAACALFLLPESLPAAARRTAAAVRRSLSPMAALRRPRVGQAILLSFLATICFAAMEATFALFGQRRYGLGPHHVGYLLAFVGTVAALLQAGVVGALARRFGEAALIRAGLLLMGAGLIGMGAGPVFALLVVGMGTVAVGSSISGPSLAGLITISSDADEQGGILGVYQSTASLARAVGPFLGGLAFDHVGAGSPMWLGGGVLVCASFIAARLPKRIA